MSQSSMIAFLLLLSLACGAGPSRQAVDFYVAPDGDDANAGTLEMPFATVERARRAVRDLPKKDVGEIRVQLRDGTYYLNDTVTFTPGDSGSEDTLVIYQAYENETPVLSGGIRLTGTWKEHAGGVMVCALDQKGIRFDELFVNGSRQQRSRYPDYKLIDGFDQGYETGLSAKEWPHQKVYFDPNQFSKKRWSKPSEAVLHAFPDRHYGNLQWRLRDVDWKNHAFVLGEGGWQIPSLLLRQPGTEVGPRSKYFVDNVFEELDSPGEWYLDHAHSLLYFLPPVAMDVSEAVFEGSQRQTLIAFRGTREQPVHHIKVSGLTFARAKPVYLERYEMPSMGDWSLHRSGAVFFEGAEDCAVEFSDFDAVGGNGVFVSNHARRIRIYGNRFIGAGESAICLVGKPHLNPNKRYRCRFCNAEHWWGWDEPSGEYPQECVISNNLIRDLGQYGKQTAGVFISVSSKNTVSHNRIFNTPRAAICINDGWMGGHVIEFNDIYKTVNETSDHGPFNSWGRDRAWCRRQSHPGWPLPDGISDEGLGDNHHEADDYLAEAKHTTYVRNNRFCDQAGWGIDLDDGSSNYHVYNNLCLGISVKLREGDRRLVYNNIFVKPAIPPGAHVGYINNHDRFVRNIIVTSSEFDRPEDDVDWKTGRAGGAIYRFILAPPEGPILEEIDYNVFHNDVGEFFAVMQRPDKRYSLDEWRKLGYDRNSVFADPLFVDPEGGDFRVQADSPALKLGFKNFDLDKVGLLPDFPEKWRD